MGDLPPAVSAVGLEAKFSEKAPYELSFNFPRTALQRCRPGAGFSAIPIVERQQLVERCCEAGEIGCSIAGGRLP
jgi:hypothetical protein